MAHLQACYPAYRTRPRVGPGSLQLALQALGPHPASAKGSQFLSFPAIRCPDRAHLTCSNTCAPQVPISVPCRSKQFFCILTPQGASTSQTAGAKDSPCGCWAGALTSWRVPCALGREALTSRAPRSCRLGTRLQAGACSTLMLARPCHVYSIPLQP